MVSRPKLKLFFTDFWESWNLNDNYFTKILSKDFDLEITPNDPDILIYSWEGQVFKNFNCIRIYYTPENQLMPKYKECDFSMSFEYWNDKRNLRLPNYLLYEIHPNDLDKKQFDIEKLIDSKTGFCSMVVSNPNSRKRNSFFHQLSKYKKVLSGGRHLNNIGGNVSDKYSFISQFKFNLCFENASHPGYTTEKIVQAMKCMTIPIYWGNPLIHLEFNINSFFNYSEYENENHLIQDIIDHDIDETKYYKKFIEPWFLDDTPNQFFDNQRTRKFLYEIIINRRSITPIAKNTFKRLVYYPLGNRINMAKAFIKK